MIYLLRVCVHVYVFVYLDASLFCKINVTINMVQVTWVEHSEYEENSVHQLYKPLISAGMGFGAQRWITTLQRQCECLAILMSSTVSSRDHTGITDITCTLYLLFSTFVHHLINSPFM